jgi:hypothetical protein
LEILSVFLKCGEVLENISDIFEVEELKLKSFFELCLNSANDRETVLKDLIKMLRLSV